MKIVLTGANGFLGAYLLDVLSKNNEVIGIARQKKDNASIVFCDITYREKLLGEIKDTIKNADILIHAAAEISDAVAPLYKTNCFGTQNVVDLAMLIGCKRFINISSIPVIGNGKDYSIENPILEEITPQPQTVYHLTKYLGELIVEKTLKNYCSYANIRIASPVGIRMPNSRIFSVFVNNSLRGDDIVIQGDGNRVQNYLDIRDFSEAINKCMNSTSNGTFNITGNSISDRELAEMCIKENNSTSRIIIKGLNDVKTEKWFVSGKKAENELGYKPSHSIKDSIKYVAEGLK
ncbi:MAG: NAD(P)-dependent oxidoreductase [Clostridium sp.]|nr:NAD(P)-dependent oxidoreductase [Clostridium sp.]